MRRLRWRLEAALVRAAIRICRALGPVTASDLGGFLARSIGPLLPVSRVAHANLRRAMPELDGPARRRIVRGMWDNLGRTVAELPHIGRLRRTATGPGWELTGEGIVRQVADAGGPVIWFSGHLGNWELLPAVLASFGIALSSFYRAASNPLVDGSLADLRAAATGGTRNFPKGAAGAKAALQHLRQGGYLGMLIDQKMNDGIASTLFGQTAMTAPAAAAYSLRFGCPLIPGHAERLGPARFRLVCDPPLALPLTGDRTVDIAALTAEINRSLEGWIRARPQDWLWLHRRWPPEPRP